MRRQTSTKKPAMKERKRQRRNNQGTPPSVSSKLTFLISSAVSRVLKLEAALLLLQVCGRSLDLPRGL
jgi:hypothetical protein